MNRQDAKQGMLYELEAMQQDLTVTWLDHSLPEDWKGMEGWEPVAREKTRVNMRLDADMVRWFRKLGPGYTTRINRVLRIYWMSLLAGYIKAFPCDNTVPRLANEAQRLVEELAQDRADREAARRRKHEV